MFLDFDIQLEKASSQEGFKGMHSYFLPVHVIFFSLLNLKIGML